MSFYKIHDVDDKNKVNCFPKDTTNYSGIVSCSKYIEPSKTINYGIDYSNGEYYQKTQDILPINYEFNNLNFAHIIENNTNIENIDQCFNQNNCINKELYAKKKFKSNELTNKGNFLEICKDKQLCEEQNYSTNNKYLIQKVCFDKDCYYTLHCGCDKK
jgi:hypothetical protein